MSPFNREALCAETQRADPNRAYYFVPCMAAIACSAGLMAALARLEWSSPILVACATKAAYDVLAIHIVAQEDGAPLQPNSLTHEFVRLLAKAKVLPKIRFHDLRHTHATHLLTNGVHPKVAQERLGHSSVGITLDLYSHVLPGMQEDAAAKVDAAIRAALDKA
jgi:integrase